MASKIPFRDNFKEIIDELNKPYFDDCDHPLVPWGNSMVVEWIELLAALGDANANFQLSICYITGNCVKKNFSKAKLCLENAAKEIVMAQFVLGVCYTFGVVTEKDSKKAVYWYDIAAKNGSNEALCNLGICYLSGFGVERNFEIAFDFFIKAAETKNKFGLSEGNGYAQYLCYRNSLIDWMFRGNDDYRFNKIRKIFCKTYESEYEERWLKLLANQGIRNAQQVYIALSMVGKFKTTEHYNRTEKYYNRAFSIDDLRTLLKKWNLNNDPFANLILGIMIKKEYYKSDHQHDSEYNYGWPEVKQFAEAMNHLTKAVDGGIYSTIYVFQHWWRQQRIIHVFEHSTCYLRNVRLRAAYLENDPNCPIEERIFKEDEPLCFRPSDDSTILYVDYFSKQWTPYLTETEKELRKILLTPRMLAHY